MSGTQKAKIEAAAVALAHPDKVRITTLMEEALDATDTAERAARATLQEVVGVGHIELDEVLGSPTLTARIRARMGEAASTGATEADSALQQC